MTSMDEVSIEIDEQEQIRQKLLWNVKREVKQMMEEAVMKKCIHEENCSITTLCGAVEACLLHGLKRRAVGLFKTSTTMALLQKIAKTCPSAAEVVKIVDDDSHHSEETSNLFSFSKKLSSITQQQAKSTEDNRRRSNRVAWYNRYLWIRTALINRSLHKIVEYIVSNSTKYYESYGIVCNSVQGPILASLLAGPCALEFTRMKTSDHLWTDPHADELVQRHRMHSSNRPVTNPTAIMINVNNSHSPKFKPRLQINLKRHASASSEDAQRTNQIPSTSNNPARDYVESLHQNAKSQLIYGKNNVLVQPTEGHDPMPGYLSLHLNQAGLTLKWTPNQLMSGYGGNANSLNGLSQTSDSTNSNNSSTESPKQASVYWDYAISVNMVNIVYLHCHQHVDGDRIVLVGRDGVQHPPLHIKDKGGHLLAFLTCLESGLAPNGKLDPPLWFEQGQGKVFPKLHHRTEQQRSCPISLNTSDDDSGQLPAEILDEESTSVTNDYVFRIVFFPDHETISSNTNVNRWQWPTVAANLQSVSAQVSLSPPGKQHNNSQSSSPLPTTPVSPNDSAFATSAVYVSPASGLHKSLSVRTSIASLCDTMRRQILSRAFYGWLAYCRHLKTVRIHLTALVYPVSSMITGEEQNTNSLLTIEGWTELFISKQQEHLPIDKREIYRRIYYGGCSPAIRKQVWPFLFAHYSFDTTIDERTEIDRTTADRYRSLIADWRSAEEIVVQLDAQRANRCKNPTVRLPNFSIEPFESTISAFKTLAAKASLPTFDVLERKDSTMSNEVFFEDCPVHTVNIPIQEETSQPTTPSAERHHSFSSVQSVLVARTRTESVIDRSSPYNIIETSTENEENEDEMQSESLNDNDNVIMTEQIDPKPIAMDNAYINRVEVTSPSSSLASSIDIYMDAVDTINEDENSDKKSDGSLTPIYYGPFSKELIEAFSANLHRIDKDVARCDRTYTYFTNTYNLKKLRNIMCTYVWDNLATGYIQGMCDLVAPFLVVFDEEVIAYSCFCYLMKRLLPNFPHGAGMDEHFGHMRSLLQILDSELYEHIHRTGDFTHFYFCYRWFLLDFKREFVYDDIFLVWETIAAARRMVSKRFVLFIALAMIKSYREIILDNRMDFTDIIRFFNEMAERHVAREILRTARELVLELQKLIDNK